MRRPFFGRYALAILVIVCFFVPFALRGARLAVLQMKNEVKDWLPSSFEETAQMDWFWRRFTGERFIVVSWEGCTAADESFRALNRARRAVTLSALPQCQTCWSFRELEVFFPSADAAPKPDRAGPGGVETAPEGVGPQPGGAPSAGGGTVIRGRHRPVVDAEKSGTASGSHRTGVGI